MTQENKKNEVGIVIPPSFDELPPDQQRRLKRGIILGLGILVVFIIISVSIMSVIHKKRMSQEAAQWEAPGIAVGVIEVKKSQLDEIVEATGVVQPIHSRRKPVCAGCNGPRLQRCHAVLIG